MSTQDLVPVPELVAIPGGLLRMGKADSRPDEAPVHEVEIAPFRAGVRPVTNREFAAFVEATGATPPPFLGEERFAVEDGPVVGVNWFDATAYCAWLSEQTGIAFRLPTEAEREYGALGGLPGGDWPWLGEHHPEQEVIDAMDGPHVPLASCANGYGLFCMAENVHEWCANWYRPYDAEDPGAPGPAKTPRRASRGGSWRHREKTTRVNARSSLSPVFRYSDFGMRVYADAERVGARTSRL